MDHALQGAQIFRVDMVTDVVDNLGIKGTSSGFLIDGDTRKTAISALDHLDGDLVGTGIRG